MSNWITEMAEKASKDMQDLGLSELEANEIVQMTSGGYVLCRLGEGLIYQQDLDTYAPTPELRNLFEEQMVEAWDDARAVYPDWTDKQIEASALEAGEMVKDLRRILESAEIARAGEEGHDGDCHLCRRCKNAVAVAIIAKGYTTVPF